MRDLTVADQFEFESWPEDKQKLAYMYVANDPDKFYGQGIEIEDVYNVAYNRGYYDGLAVHDKTS